MRPLGRETVEQAAPGGGEEGAAARGRWRQCRGAERLAVKNAKQLKAESRIRVCAPHTAVTSVHLIAHVAHTRESPLPSHRANSSWGKGRKEKNSG